jgi:hypothetical protein
MRGFANDKRSRFIPIIDAPLWLYEGVATRSLE